MKKKLHLPQPARAKANKVSSQFFAYKYERKKLTITLVQDNLRPKLAFWSQYPCSINDDGRNIEKCPSN
jgi:hypothetical protein